MKIPTELIGLVSFSIAFVIGFMFLVGCAVAKFINDITVKNNQNTFL